MQHWDWKERQSHAQAGPTLTRLGWKLGGSSGMQKHSLRSNRSQPYIMHRIPGFQCQEETSSQLLAVKTSSNWGWEGSCCNPGIPFKGPMQTYLDSFTLSSRTCTSRTYREELSSSWATVQDEGAGFSTDRNGDRTNVPFLGPTEPVGGHLIWFSINLANTVLLVLVIPWDPTPTNLQAQANLFTVAYQYKWQVLAHASYFPQIFQTSIICIPLAKWPSPGTSSSQAWFEAWSLLGISSPAQVIVICRWLCNTFWVTPDKAQVMAHFGLHISRGPIANSSCG